MTGVTLLLTAVLSIWNVGTMPGAALGQDAVTVQGEVVDLSCFLANGSRGAAHKSCAQMCAKRGLPLGVLTEGGDLYLLLDDHDNSDPYDQVKKDAGLRVEVSGKRFVRNGMNGIVVGSVKEL